jgi:short-subunit dehydrogenase
MSIGNKKQKYGEWAIVTGASDGIGKACAIELAKSGYKVVLAARRKELLEQLSAELSTKYGVQCLVVAGDLSLQSDIEKLTQQTSALNVGLLIAAAGFGTSGRFIDVPIAEELSMLDVNCRAVVSLTHHYGNLFRNHKRGGIILFGSLVGFQGAPRAANYAATKAYIQTLAEGLRVEMKPFGVDVLSVAPGPVNTGFATRAKMNLGSGAEKPEVIAKGALTALGNRATVRPGFIAKFLGYSLSTAPRFIRVMIMTAIMGGMTKQQ